jgi:chaperone protein EcpD
MIPASSTLSGAFRLIAREVHRAIPGVMAASMLVAGTILSSATEASVVIAATRVVYNATDSEVTVKLSNVGKAPALTQVWLDKGDMRADPSELDLPFIVTPPLARIDPGRAQTVRIAYTNEPLPTDRETLFWLNVLEVPPKPDAEQTGPNYVQLAFRSRLKVFFRPAGLPGNASEAPEKLTWHLTTQDGKAALQVRNPTAYHVTIIEAQVGQGEAARKFDKGDMVPPGGQIALPLSGIPARVGKVSFTTLNDSGGPVQHEAALQ